MMIFDSDLLFGPLCILPHDRPTSHFDLDEWRLYNKTEQKAHISAVYSIPRYA